MIFNGGYCETINAVAPKSYCPRCPKTPLKIDARDLDLESANKIKVYMNETGKPLNTLTWEELCLAIRPRTVCHKNMHRICRLVANQ
jgi:hypothetical protein